MNARTDSFSLCAVSRVCVGWLQAQGVADQIKADAEKAVNRTFSQWQVVEYQTQVVAGTNYFFKVPPSLPLLLLRLLLLLLLRSWNGQIGEFLLRTP